MRKQSKEDKKKKRRSEFEAMIMQIIEQSLKKTLKTALDEIEKEWK